MSIQVGDRVQIKSGAIDVTTGVIARTGNLYVEGSSAWVTVDLIDEYYYTGGKFGLPSVITKVRCINDAGIVVWQGRSDSFSSQVIKSSDPSSVQTRANSTASTNLVPTESGSAILGSDLNPLSTTDTSVSRLTTVSNYTRSVDISPLTARTESVVQQVIPQMGSHTAIGNFKRVEYETAGKNSSVNIPGLKENDVIKQKVTTAYQIPPIKRQMLNEDIENIQNVHGFPAKLQDSIERGNRIETAKYDYQIKVGDTRYPLMVSLESKLRDVRAALGIPVHGSSDIAKAMKYYMYNRFKTPDTNMAHNKSFTHVFFTRPDCNLLRPWWSGGGANSQTINHSETSILWRRNPELFKLLTDSYRCGDSHNFNLLLSNQITSFEIADETLATNEAGESWSKYKMVYGDIYDGRSNGDFTCNFIETNDYSVINFFKLWITYIDNVSRGEWSPSYNLHSGEGVSGSQNASYVYTKTLDYAASAYVFKCGPDGSDILYWSKYYGIIPTNTGASALSWDIGQSPGDTPKLSIRFKYAFKRDMSPISLLEFNHNAKMSSADTAIYPEFNVNIGHTARPYVGAPFIEMNVQNSRSSGSKGGARIGPDNAPSTSIRLRFRTNSENRLTDDQMYRSNMANR